MGPAAHPLDVLDGDGDGRGVPQLEPDIDDLYRRQWQALNEIELPTIAAHATRQ